MKKTTPQLSLAGLYQKWGNKTNLGYMITDFVTPPQYFTYMITDFVTPPQYFTYSASLSEALGLPVAKIYYYVRACDVEGKGWAIISLEHAAATLQRSQGTILNSLYTARQKGVFYKATKLPNNKCFVKYKLDIKICVEKGIRLGAIARARLADLPHLKFLAADATIEAVQKSSLKNAALEVSKNQDDDRTVLDLDKLFNHLADSAESRGVGHLATGKRCSYFSAKVAPVGGKQATAAELLGRSIRTIQRRLNPRLRVEKGAPLLQKTQVAIEVGITLSAIQNLKAAAVGTSDLDLFQESRRFFTQKINGVRRVFYACTNLYNACGVELSKQRHKRSRFKKLLTATAGSTPLDLSNGTSSQPENLV